MSPASKYKTKSKDNASSRAVKEQKASLKPSGSTNTPSGSPASARNPISGTFHTLGMTSSAFSPPLHDNGCFRNIDDADEHSNSPHETVSEYDSVSNNGSCSGESEDSKEKTNLTKQETVPGSDKDRREKIRLKNEKKHQRQKDRRAQELHERCNGYLMSRKLESLSEKLVSMGFSHERAMLALVFNKGKVEESVNWLFEGNEEEAHNKDRKLGSSGDLKIDISEELAQISALEVKHKCSKQEVERAVVSCEGDLLKAEEILRSQKQEPPPTQTIDANLLKRTQEKAMSSASITTQQRRNDRDNFYTNAAMATASYSEPGSRNLQHLNQSKALADKRWAVTGSSPSFSLGMASLAQVTPSSAKLDFRLGISGNDGKNHQHMPREPVIMMQRPQSVNAKQNQVPSISASPSVTAGWHSNNVPGIDVRSLFPYQGTGSLGLVNQNPDQFFHPVSYKESAYLFDGPVDSTAVGLGGSWCTMGNSPAHMVHYEPHSAYAAVSASSPSLAAPSPLGLFSKTGSARTLGSSHVDWDTGVVPEFDYTSIDWTLDSNLLPSKPSRLWLGLSSLLRNTSGTTMNGMNGSCISELRDSRVPKEPSSFGGLHDWTSPFAGSDMFSIPRQFVTSPSPYI